MGISIHSVGHEHVSNDSTLNSVNFTLRLRVSKHQEFSIQIFDI